MVGVVVVVVLIVVVVLLLFLTRGREGPMNVRFFPDLEKT